MDEFSALCMSSEAKINLFIRLNKYEGKVNLQKVVDFSKEYKWTDMGLKTLRNVDIKEEIDIELEEVKPNRIRSVISNILMNAIPYISQNTLH